MIIGVTGATSTIGEATVAAIERMKHHAVRLVRTPRSPSDRHYDLGQPIHPETLTGVDAVIHLAWDWRPAARESLDPNVEAGRRLVRACVVVGARPVLLSTYSTFSADTSVYGTAKASLEAEFRADGGTALRAGLIWGNQPSGMVSTVLRIARLPLACPHLTPDPTLHHSEIRTLAARLVEATTTVDSETVLAASAEAVRLSEIVHSARRRGTSVHVTIPTRALLAAARSGERLGVPLPFRSDSLPVADDTNERAVMSSTLCRLDGFPGREAFLGWIASIP